MKFSVVIITKNEASIIAKCIEPLLAISDDIIIVDSGSTDGTQEIATQLGARVLEVEWKGYAETKNWGHQQAKNDWILSIDADEIVSKELKQNLLEWNPDTGVIYSLDRITSLGNDWIYHSGWYPDWKTRLFDRNKAYWSGGPVHEHLEFNKNSSVKRMTGKLYHYSYSNDGELITMMNKYAKLSAQKMFENNQKAPFGLAQISPFARFIKTYFIKKGFLDGRNGWKIASRDFKMVKLKYKILRDLYRN